MKNGTRCNANQRETDTTSSLSCTREGSPLIIATKHYKPRFCIAFNGHYPPSVCLVCKPQQSLRTMEKAIPNSKYVAYFWWTLPTIHVSRLLWSKTKLMKRTKTLLTYESYLILPRRWMNNANLPHRPICQIFQLHKTKISTDVDQLPWTHMLVVKGNPMFQCCCMLLMGTAHHSCAPPLFGPH